jgi:Mor family transcriptional regulator
LNDTNPEKFTMLPDEEFGHEWLFSLDEQEIYESVPEYLRELMRVIGVRAALRLAIYHSGQNLYLRKTETDFRRLRDRLIRDEFKGDNVNAICRKYNLARSTVYGIVNAPDPDQMGLFEGASA